MRRLVVAGCLLLGVFTCPPLLFSAAAEEKKAEKAEKAEKQPFWIMDRLSEQRFNLNDSEDVNRLLNHLRTTDDVELELTHESHFMAQMADLGIWTLVVFVLVLLILGKYAWKPMLEGLQRREKSIQAALDEAHKARDEAARLRTEFEDQQRKANDQARQILEEARRAAERTAAEMTAEAHKKIQAEHERLQREMNLAYDQARRDIQTQVAELATLVAGKVLRRQVNHDDHRQLVEEALTEMQQTGNGRRQTALA